MNKLELEFIKRNKRWPIIFADVFSRYFFVIFPIALLIMVMQQQSQDLKTM
jgi:hypothetical protein